MVSVMNRLVASREVLPSQLCQLSWSENVGSLIDTLLRRLLEAKSKVCQMPGILSLLYFRISMP